MVRKNKFQEFFIILGVILAISNIAFVFIASHNTYNIEKMDEQLQSRINKYEQAILNIETSLKDQDKDFMNEFYKLRLDWTNEKIELEAKKGSVDREIYKIYVFATAFMIIGSLGIFATLRSAINRSMYEHISSLTKENKEIIKEIIKNNREEEELKREKEILILAQEEDSNKKLEMFLESMGFKNITVQIWNDIINFEDYHLVILNREDDIFGWKKAEEIVKDNSNIKFFDYVVNKDNWMKDNRIKNVLNRSNSQITLYRNLLETLKICDKIELLEEGAL